MEFKTDVLLHGGDYNPDQWLDRPDILEKDVEMLAESGCNVVSLGIFAWSTLEPEEGVFRLDWMEEVIDRLYAKGIRVILATPSGSASGGPGQKKAAFWNPTQSLLYIAGLPGKGTDHQPETGGTLRKSSGSNPLAYFQRIWRRVPLSSLPGRFP